LSAIKVNKDKIEVISAVSQPPSDLVTQLSAISDKFDRAFNDQNNLVASVITHLEKVEGKHISFDISDDHIPQVDSQGVLHQNTLAATGASSEVPMYIMSVGFFRDNRHCPNRPRLDCPPWSV
jgi:hypothetical protein